jgi:hypothetical protein
MERIIPSCWTRQSRWTSHLLDHHQEQRVAEEVAHPRRAEQEVERAVQVAETEASD